MHRYIFRWRFRVAPAITADAAWNDGGFGPDLLGPIQHLCGVPQTRLVWCRGSGLPHFEAHSCVGVGVGGSFGSLRPFRPMRHDAASDLNRTFLTSR